VKLGRAVWSRQWNQHLTRRADQLCQGWATASAVVPDTMEPNNCLVPKAGIQSQSTPERFVPRPPFPQLAMNSFISGAGPFEAFTVHLPSHSPHAIPTTLERLLATLTNLDFDASSIRPARRVLGMPWDWSAKPSRHKAKPEPSVQYLRGSAPRTELLGSHPRLCEPKYVTLAAA
jgi:hypothetical protein